MTNNRFAYYLWQFPILSETFIQREITAIRNAGLPLTVIADRPGDMDSLDPATQSMIQETEYLFPLSKMSLIKSLLQFLLFKPKMVYQAAHLVFSIRHQHRQNLIENLLVLLKSIYLAGYLNTRMINHAHCPWSDVNAFILLVAAKLAGITYSVQARAHDLYRYSANYALSEKFRFSSFIITNCHFNETNIKAIFPDDKRPDIHMIYDGLPMNQFHPASMRKNPLLPARILAVGRLIEQKGYHYLLKACKILKDAGIKFHCTIIGGVETPLYVDHPIQLKKEQQELSLNDQVVFAGARSFDYILQAYAEADIFVLPCVNAADGSRDVTPNALMEAMAMKLPVISTTLAAIPEIVENEISGLLVPPMDEKALALAMKILIEDETMRHRLGENARRQIEDKFDIAKNINQFNTLFDQILKKTKIPNFPVI